MNIVYCPKCGREYAADSQRFCDEEGARLVARSTTAVADDILEVPIASASSIDEQEKAVAAAAASSFVVPDGTTFDLVDLDPLDDAELIRDREVAEILRSESPDRHLDPIDDDNISLELDNQIPITNKPESLKKTAAKRIDPRDVPSGHVDLDERAESLRENDFDPNTPTAFVRKTVKGRYKVIELTSIDETGWTFIAEDQLADERRVSLKILRKDGVSDELAETLAEERVTLSHLIHPNIARVFDSGSFNEGPLYLISEQLDGLTLGGLLKIHSKLEPQRAGRIIRQVAYALGDAHKQGVIHRDIRPEAIELEPDSNGYENIKLGGFGTSSGTMSETNAYFRAPEVIDGDASTVASDVFSLGVVAYLTLKGSLPFDGDTDRELLRNIQGGFWAKTESEKVLAKALSWNPKHRYSTAREFGDELSASVASTSANSAASVVRIGSVASALPIKSEKVLSPEMPATLKGPETQNPTQSTTVSAPWERRSPDPVAEPSKNWVTKAIIAFSLLILGTLVVWNLISRNPTTSDAEQAPVRSVEPAPSDVPPEKREMPQPADTSFFQNNRANLKNDIYRNFIPFSLYVPNSWKILPPAPASSKEIRGKFFDASSTTSDGKLKEQMLISYYPSKGSYIEDAEEFPKLAKETSETLSKLIPGFQVISEGRTKVNGNWHAYEVKFQGSGETSKGEKLTVWGRRLFIPTARPGIRSGFEITLLATSNSDAVKSVDDVGLKGDLATMLYTFEPGTNY